MKKPLFAILAGAMLAVGACNPTYDKDKTHAENLDAMTEGMTAEQRSEFDDACDLIARNADSEQAAVEALDGKTMEEIYAMAEEIRRSKIANADVNTPSYSESTSYNSGESSIGPRYDVRNPAASLRAMECYCSPEQKKMLGRAMERLHSIHGLRFMKVIDGKTVDEIIEMAN